MAEDEPFVHRVGNDVFSIVYQCYPACYVLLVLCQFTHIYNKVETLYEDRELAVIYKPEGLLSVPGKDAAQPSV